MNKGSLQESVGLGMFLVHLTSLNGPASPLPDRTVALEVKFSIAHHILEDFPADADQRKLFYLILPGRNAIPDTVLIALKSGLNPIDSFRRPGYP